jgi:hypothetical protein
MGNREQMMHVAANCFSYDSVCRMTISCAGRTCENCSQYAEGSCLKDLFETELITID